MRLLSFILYKMVHGIVGEYGENTFNFSDTAITVTIPYNRLDLGGTPQVTPQVTPQDEYEVQEDNIENKIIEYCSKARSTQEILVYLELKDRKNLMVYGTLTVE